MPVQLTDTLGLNDNICRCNRLGDGEVGRVNLPPLTGATGSGLRSMLEGAVHIRRIACKFTCATSDGPELGGLTRGAVEDVWVPLGNLVKDAFRKTKALCDDRLWCLCKPVIEVECRAGER